jgi:3-oxoacyl-[acyl-carrier-protein] synthase II
MDVPVCHQKPIITGLGMLNALGLGRTTYWQQLLRGVSGLETMPAVAGDTATDHLAVRIKGFDPKACMRVQFYRRLSRLSRLAVAASCEALTESGLSITDNNRQRLGVVFGSAYGSTHQTDAFFVSLLEHGPQAAEPILFPDTVPNAPASHVAMYHQLQGPNSTFCQNHLSGENALAFAASLLAGDHADALVVGGADELSPILLHSLEALQVIEPQFQSGPQAPGQLSFGRGFVPGEAATCLVLERPDQARQRQAPVYGTLLAVELVGAEARQGHYASDTTALVEAMRAALATAGLRPVDIDILGVAANGVAELEVMEVAALEKVFGTRWQQVPRLPLRYFVGEFGAAGLLTVATILLALREGLIPPALYGPHCAGTAGAHQRFTPARQAGLRHGLIIGSTFGGGSSCVIVGRGNP